MALFKWDDSYSVSVKNMDDQHKRLFQLLDEFYESLSRNDSREATKEIVVGLKSYTILHFSAEERLMKQIDYPGLEEQLVAHKFFVDKVEEYQERLNSGKLLISLEVTGFLKDWLLNHILKIDKKYSQFMNENGIK